MSARSNRVIAISTTIFSVVILLFGVPWLALVIAPAWSPGWTWAGSAVFLGAAISLPALMVLGHGRRHSDLAAALGDSLLGVMWVLFSWSIVGFGVRVLLAILGVKDTAGILAAFTVAVSAGLLVYGFFAAMRVPGIAELDVVIDRLSPGLDGLRIVAITDTHYGPINRERWSVKIVELINTLDADIVVHVGDLADGSVSQRENQTKPLANVRARLARAYVTGNHEYFSEAQAWLDYMASIGWESLHNRHLEISRGDGRLILAGIDDATAAHSHLEGHGANLVAALDGADPDLPIVLLAHQPKQVHQAVAAGVDLQIAGHTHGGQIWPFRYLVRLDQPVVAGLARFGKTQLYTSRGTGFWGPPFRILAPSEVTVLTLKSA